jgi:hypothetical protein
MHFITSCLLALQLISIPTHTTNAFLRVVTTTVTTAGWTSFSPSQQWRQQQQHELNTLQNLKESTFQEKEEETLPSGGKTSTTASSSSEQLVFDVVLDRTSSAIQATDTREICQYIQSPDCIMHYCSGGGRLNCSLEENNSVLNELWQRACEEYYGREHYYNNRSNENSKQHPDRIIATETVLQFPGLKMINRVYNVIKIVDTKESSSSSSSSNPAASIHVPELLSFMIGEKQQVKGLPPAVWLFNKLTGYDTRKNQSISPSSGSAFTRITWQTDDTTTTIGTTSNSATENNTMGRLRIQAHVTIRTNFPKALLRILPVSKAKMEQQGSQAVRKSIEKELDRACDTGAEHFHQWKQQQQPQQQQ